jgi:glutamine synthetase
VNDTPEIERLLFVGACDLAGLVRGKAFPLADLDWRRRSGVGYTGSNIMMSAFGPIYATPFGTAGDLKLVPDLGTRAVVRTEDGTSVELALGDLRTLDGSPWNCCPRAFLRRGLDALEAEFGLRLLAAFEHEFVYTGVSPATSSSYAFERYRQSGGFGGSVFSALRAADIDPDSFLPEYGERQFEITVKPRAGIRAADDAVLVREIVRACAAERAARAIFAPVLTPDGIGNGTHIHFSLLDDNDRPVTYDPAGSLGISSAVEPFMAGILAHLPALTALTAPSVASYFRLRPNKWAPTWADIGVRDRGVALRVCPLLGADPDRAAHEFNIEYRVADATANPYLTLGAIVHAGLDGLRRTLPLPNAGPVGEASPPGALRLPASLEAALDTLERTPVAGDWFGAEFLAVYLLFKRSEISAVAGLSEAEVCSRYVDVY